MDRISAIITYQKAKADQDQKLSEEIDKFVRGKTATCPSLDEWSINLRELKAEHFDQVRWEAEGLKELVAVKQARIDILEKECDRMTGRYINATNRVPEPILPDCPISDQARKIIDNLK
jgi:hypothetical protein